MYFGFPGVIEMLMVVVLGSGVGLPLGIPPAEEDPLMAKVAPEECLFYTTWAGVAEADPDSGNQVEQLVAEPEVQQMLSGLEKHIVAALMTAAEREGPETTQAIQDGAKWVKKLLTSPTAMFLSSVKMGPNGPEVQGGLLVNVGEDALQLKATLQKYQTALLQGAAKPVQIDGETWHQFQPAPEAPVFTWGLKKRYFIVGVGEGAVEDILERARTDAPAWLTGLRQQLPVERTSTVTYVNVKGIVDAFAPMGGPEVKQVIEALGLGNVSALSSVTGLDKQGFISRTLLGIDGEPEGLFAMLPKKPLQPADLAPIPADATIAMALQLDPDEVFEAILNVVGKIEPRAREEMLREMDQSEVFLGFSVRNDLLQAMGDTWCIYNSPAEGGLVFTGLTGVVKVKDRQRLDKVQQAIVRLVEEESAGASGQYRPQPRIEKFQFAGKDVYVFNARDDDFPVAPTWCLTEEELIVAAYPQNVKAYLSRGSEVKSLATVPQVAGLFGSSGGPIALTYCDTPKLFELVYPLAPIFAQMALSELARQEIDIPVSLLPSAPSIGRHLSPGVADVRRTAAGIEMTSRQSLPGGSIGATAPLIAAMVVPATVGARHAAQRTQSINNLKQIGLGLLNHESAKGKFPPAYTVDKNGKPLLSWRVHILPYIEGKNLYDQFHLDEPWDSDHNKKLIAQMPHFLRSPASQAAQGKTNYVTVRGKDTVFPGKEAKGLDDVKDGASNTIMTLEVSDQKAVIWTKPDDFTYDEKKPMAESIGLQRGGFLAGFADGSVHSFRLPPPSGFKLKGFFTRNGKEDVSLW